MTYDLRAQKERELELLRERIDLQKNLPHIYGWKFYKWAREYWESRNQVQLLSAGNQISKSSTQIRKHIHWATAIELWPELWATTPRMFWYLYPTRDVAHIEFKKKWEPEFMPRGEYRHDHPIYGWKPEFYHNRIFAIHWNSGVSTYFKTYAQDVQDLQTGSVYKLDCDEETPEELMSELMIRLAATQGYLSAVFTPTLGQEYWRCAIEEVGTSLERFPGAFKRQVSMYDCLLYEDGSRSPWTLEQIRRAENSCRNQAEIDRRIHGKFVPAEGLKYPSFHRTKNKKPGHPLPKDWSIWVGVDIGSGGDGGHPSAISCVAVSPDWAKGRVFRGWRGDGVETTASDVVRKVVELTKDLKNVQIYYDWACRDFFAIATSMGLPVEPAEKSHAIGEQVLNVLFKNEMLVVYDYPELEPLCVELSMLRVNQGKTHAKDDFIDSLRYACAKVPWNWHAIRTDLIKNEPEDRRTQVEKDLEEEFSARRKLARGDEAPLLNTMEEELSSWNELMEGNYDN